MPRHYRSQDGVLKTSIVSLRVRSAAMKKASDKSSDSFSLESREKRKEFLKGKNSFGALAAIFMVPQK